MKELPAVGPFISKHYEPEKITTGDLAAACVVWGITVLWGGVCAWQSWGQTKRARNPRRSVYVWMIWLELLACLLMGFESWCFIMGWIHPSFYFFMSILFWWCIQVHLLLQIIINRVRVITLKRERAKAIMIGTAVVVTLINISVFNIWIPARLQISERYIMINDIWDRIEKVIYLLIDASLNAYFIKAVKANLVANGLQKYNSLLKFNIRIISFSLLCDVMIIAAMSIPNSFVYIQFHPLAYLIKLNIELTMAHLIRKIAMSSAGRRNHHSVHQEFMTDSGSGGTVTGHGTHTAVELTVKSHGRRTSEFNYDGKGIQKTQEIIISREERNMDSDNNCDSEVQSNSTKDDRTSTRMEDDDDESPIVRDTWDHVVPYKSKAIHEEV